MRTEVFRNGDTTLTLICGDCIEAMREIGNGSIHAIITDPPYGCTECEWDIGGIDLGKFWEACLPTGKENAAYVICGQQPFGTDLINSNRKMFRYNYVWKKPSKTNFLNANKMPMREHEEIYVFYRRLPTFNTVKTAGEPYAGNIDVKQVNHCYARLKQRTSRGNPTGGRWPTSIIEVSGADIIFNRRNEWPHPTRKPEKLMEKMVLTYTMPGETVLDPYMGSGTTAAACARTGRSFVGIERDEGYFETACRRIGKALADTGRLPELLAQGGM